MNPRYAIIAALLIVSAIQGCGPSPTPTSTKAVSGKIESVKYCCGEYRAIYFLKADDGKLLEVSQKIHDDAKAGDYWTGHWK